MLFFCTFSFIPVHTIFCILYDYVFFVFSLKPNLYHAFDVEVTSFNLNYACQAITFTDSHHRSIGSRLFRRRRRRRRRHCRPSSQVLFDFPFIIAFQIHLRVDSCPSLPPRLDELAPSILVSTKLRSFIHRYDGNSNNAAQIGKKPRKAPSQQGACFVVTNGEIIYEVIK